MMLNKNTIAMLIKRSKLETLSLKKYEIVISNLHYNTFSFNDLINLKMAIE